MSFRTAASLLALVCLVLFLVLLVVPKSYVGVYGIAGDEGVAFLGRRASPMFLGLAVMLWLGRSAKPSPLRTAIIAGVATLFAGIAVTGAAEYLFGAASPSILLAACAEIAIAVVLLGTIRR